MNRLDRIKGCLLGGAVGDALGAPVEFLDWATIERKFGSSGIRDFAQANGVTGAITDDTQMMLHGRGTVARPCQTSIAWPLSPSVSDPPRAIALVPYTGRRTCHRGGERRMADSGASALVPSSPRYDVSFGTT